MLSTRILGLATLLLFSSSAFGQLSTIAVKTYSDRVKPTSGIAIDVLGSSGAWFLNSGSNGLTEFVEFGGPETFLLTVHEATTSQGTHLGQQFARVAAATGLEFETIHYFQPTIRPYYFGTSKVVHPNGHLRWTVSPNGVNANYSFRGQLGVLLDTSQIAALYDYNSAPLPVASYATGLVLRSGGASLTGGGAAIGFDLSGHNFAGVPVMDVLLPNGTTPASTPTTNTILWEPATSIARFALEGDLPRGDVFLLVRDSMTTSSGATLQRPVFTPPPILLPSTPTPGSVDCIVSPPGPPPAPGPQLTCPDSAALESGAYCPPPVQILGKDEYWGTLPAMSPVCKVAGQTLSGTITTSYTGGVTTSVSWGPFSVGVSGMVNHQESHSTSYTFGGDCGECLQEFYHIYARAEVWEIYGKSSSMFVWNECAAIQKETTCLVVLPTSNNCLRTCN